MSNVWAGGQNWPVQSSYLASEQQVQEKEGRMLRRGGKQALMVEWVWLKLTKIERKWLAGGVKKLS